MENSKISRNTAKMVTAGIKQALRECGVPLRDAEINLIVTDDANNILSLRMEGVPPFTTTAVVINGEYEGTFYGHPDVNSSG